MQFARHEIRQKYNKANPWRRAQRSLFSAFHVQVRVFKFIFYRAAFDLRRFFRFVQSGSFALRNEEGKKCISVHRVADEL